ncbi:hypothetical protein BC831DRAFT_484713 [Entophlyctis helioformis]|nr:hypothetical protein BC831DRAFT_484713 [Entophlyctis helioformis]
MQPPPPPPMFETDTRRLNNAADVAAVAIACGMAAVSIVLLWRLRTLPPSLYSQGVRATCGLTIASALIHVIVFYVPGCFTLGSDVLMTLFVFLTIWVYVLSELEFLKVVMPFVTGLSGHFVTRLQIAVSAVEILHIASAFSPYIAQVWQPSLKLVRFSIMTIYLISDLGQQIFLLHFVLVRLKGSTLLFRTLYTMLIVAGFAVLIASIALTFVPSDGLSLQRLLRNLATLSLHVFSLVGMEILRLVLQHPNAVSAAAPHRRLRPTHCTKTKGVDSDAKRLSVVKKNTLDSESARSSLAPTSPTTRIGFDGQLAAAYNMEAGTTTMPANHAAGDTDIAVMYPTTTTTTSTATATTRL